MCQHTDVPSVPMKPDVITYPEYVMVNGQRVVQDASRPYEHASDWPAYSRKLEDFEKFKLERNHNTEQLWNFILNHVDVKQQVRHYPRYPAAFTDTDTFILWSIIRDTCVRTTNFNHQSLRNKWTSYKQCRYDDDHNIVSTSSLLSFLTRFQSYIDQLQGTPSTPTDAEKVGGNIIDFPAYVELKHELKDLDHQDLIEEDSVALAKVNMTSSTTINEVCTDNITSYNPIYMYILIQRWLSALCAPR